MKIHNNIIVVTGGGSGMGESTCRYLAEQGAKIVIIDKSENAAARVAKDTKALFFACDVSDPSAVEKIFASLPTSPRAIINCAGIAPAKRMVGKEGPLSLDWFENVIKVNLIGTFNVMRVGAAAMIKSELEGEERGVIINTASIAAFEGQIGQTAYSASKGGVVAMTLPAARELARFGIRVMTIAPGFINTPMVDHFPTEVISALKAQTVFPKRLGKPEEFATLVAHIISNPLLNGEVIRLDGAVRMMPG